MNLNLKSFLLVLIFSLLFFINFYLADAVTIQEITQGFTFNWIVLFLVIFFVCWVVLQDIFHSTPGMALIISLVLGLAGSFGVLNTFGPIVPKLDVWVFLLLAGLIVFIIRIIFKGGQDTLISLLFFAIPLAWFIFIKEKVSYGIPSNFIIIIDVILGILLVVAIIIFFVSILKPKQKKQFMIPIQTS
ncbi:MAG: hypothetical protein QXP53_00320 [Candidatus Pacearchaeota archaeon]